MVKNSMQYPRIIELFVGPEFQREKMKLRTDVSPFGRKLREKCRKNWIILSLTSPF